MATVDRPPADVSPSRACAYRVVRRVFEQGAYADRALHAEAAGLDPRERSFAMALTYTAVQRRATLDHVIERLAGRPVRQLEPPVLATLRLGLTQLLLLDGVAEHAAVDESVRLAKHDAPRAAGLVNAVMRRATRDGAAILAELDDATPEQRRGAALGSGVAGADVVRRAGSRPGARAAGGGQPAGGVVAAGQHAGRDRGGRQRSPAGARGRGARAVVRAGARRSVRRARLGAVGAGGDHAAVTRIDDAAAGARAPAGRAGARSLLGAGCQGDPAGGADGRGRRVVCVEVNSRRADGLRRTLRRMHAGDAATVLVADAADAAPERDGAFDRVLVDPPCSGLGTLQSRPDLRWRTSPERVAETAALQARILAAGAAAVRPGGVLVYSVCTISRAEGETVAERFLAGNEVHAGSVRGVRPGHVTSAAAATLGWHGWVLRRPISAPVT